MTIDEFIGSLGIYGDKLYTYTEAAKVTRKERRTIENWCRYGRRTKQHGIVVLERFHVGREAMIPGRCLIEFLRLTQL